MFILGIHANLSQHIMLRQLCCWNFCAQVEAPTCRGEKAGAGDKERPGTGEAVLQRGLHLDLEPFPILSVLSSDGEWCLSCFCLHHMYLVLIFSKIPCSDHLFSSPITSKNITKLWRQKHVRTGRPNPQVPQPVRAQPSGGSALFSFGRKVWKGTGIAMTNLLVTHFKLKSLLVIVKFLVYHSSSPSIIEWRYIFVGLGNASMQRMRLFQSSPAVIPWCLGAGGTTAGTCWAASR